MKVREIMTRNPTCVLRIDTIQSAARKMLLENVGSLPVVADHNQHILVGIITDRDIAVRAIAEGKGLDTTVDQVMSRDSLVTAHPEDDANDLIKAMADHQVRRIPILDENNSVVGIVAQADVARRIDQDKTTGVVVENISKPGGEHTQS